MILALAWLAIAGIADEREVEALLQRGVELRKERKNEEALAAFERADQLAPSPRTRAQIALAKQALGRWVDAEQDLDRALAHPEDPWIAKNREALERAAAVIDKHLASVDVTTNIDGAELWIAGTKTSTLPLAHPIRVVAGEVKLEVRREGYESLRRTIEVEGGTIAREYLPLIAHVPPQTLGSTTAVATMIVEAPPPDDGGLPGFVALGSGGALLAGAVVASVVHVVNANVWNDDAQCLIPDAGTRETICGEYRERAEAARVASIIGYGAGAAAIAAGILYFVVSEPDETILAHVGPSGIVFAF